MKDDLVERLRAAGAAIRTGHLIGVHALVEEWRAGPVEAAARIEKLEAALTSAREYVHYGPLLHEIDAILSTREGLTGGEGADLTPGFLSLRQVIEEAEALAKNTNTGEKA